jgi:hypothetical protein
MVKEKLPEGSFFYIISRSITFYFLLSIYYFAEVLLYS